MTALLDAGFVDSFRYLYPDVTGAYSWSYMFNNARANNAGWRIIHFLFPSGWRNGLRTARFILAIGDG